MWYSSLICTCTIIQNWLVQFRHHCVLSTEHMSSLIVTIFVVRVVEMVQHMTLVPIHELTKRKLFTYFINRDHFAHIFMIFFSTKYIGSKCLAASLIRHEDVTKQFTSCKTCLKYHFSWLVAGIPVSSFKWHLPKRNPRCRDCQSYWLLTLSVYKVTHKQMHRFSSRARNSS